MKVLMWVLFFVITASLLGGFGVLLAATMFCWEEIL